jgi:hypothetical protein
MPRAASVTTKIEGLLPLKNRLSTIQKKGPETVHEVLVKKAKLVLRNAKVLVPIRYGDLKRSARLDIYTSPSSTSHVVEVSFGKNPFVPYALVVHDRVIDGRTGKIIRHKGQTQAHYLSDPFDAEIENVQRDLYAAMMNLLSIIK